MIRVVVVEDSRVQRAHLVKVLEADGDITVIGEATDANEAIDTVRSQKPDVVTLDLAIPGGGGLHAIEQIMAFSPVPILVLSATVTGRESEAAVQALLAGAVDVLPKSTRWGADAERAVRERVRVLQNVSVVRHPRGRLAANRSRTGPRSGRSSAAIPIVAIGASTGGPAALAALLAGLGGLSAAVLVVQHLHPGFIDGFVAWMQRVSGLPVEIAVDGVEPQRGVVYVAPGDMHLKVGHDDRLVLDPDPPSLHRPSVNVLFSSLADRRDRRRVGVLLTGMGDDGAAGLLALRRGGAITIAQDEATSIVYGMPQAARRLDAPMRVLPLEEIAAAVRKAT